jgi:hypothetical protein
VTEALRKAPVPPTPGVVIRYPPTHAQSLLDSSTTSAIPAVVPAPAIYSPAVASVDPQPSIIPHAAVVPAQSQGQLSIGPNHTCDAPRRSARPSKGAPALTFARGLIAESGLAMPDNSNSPYLSELAQRFW